MTNPHDRIGGRRLSALAAVTAALLSSEAAQAEENDPFAPLPMVEAAELGDARGGMMINGIPVNFSIVIRSTVEGARAQGLQTTLTVNDQGGLGGAETVPFGGGTAQATNGGMSMTLPGGTTIIHQVVDDQLRTLLTNTGDNRVLSQVTDINVDMPGFINMTQTWTAHAQAGGLGRDAVLRSLGR